MNNLSGKIANTGTRVVNGVLTLIAVVMIIYSGFVLYDTIYTDRVAFLSDDLSQYRPGLTEDEPSFEEMRKINPDTRAWIMMKDTNIDYPVVQGKDDLEYAMKNVYGQNSLTGSIYLTTINKGDFTDSFNLIYGHHMDNGAMFGDIAKYADMDFFYSHQDGILITTRGAYDLKVFARLSADAYDHRIYMAGDHPASDFPDFLYYVESLAVQWDPKTDIDLYTQHIQTYINARDKNIAENGRFVFKKMSEDAVKNGMQLVAMSTCADAKTNGRQLLVATMKFHEGPLPDWYMDKFKKETMTPWGHGQADHWALLNAICVILTLLVLLPLRHTREKYRGLGTWLRSRKGFRSENVPVVLIEVLIAAFSVFWFFMTEDIRDPMVIVDYWTLAMIILAAIMVAVDKLLFKREKEKDSYLGPEPGDGAGDTPQENATPPGGDAMG